MIRPTDSDTDFFDIVTGILQGDILAPYTRIICQYFVLLTSTDLIKENDFTLKKGQKQTMSHRIYRKPQQSRWSNASCKYICPC